MNNTKRPTTKFDLRPVDFQSGKRLAIPRSEMVQCDCCGRWLSRGFNTVSGEKIGSGCANIADMIRYQEEVTSKWAYAMGMSQKHADFFEVKIIQ